MRLDDLQVKIFCITLLQVVWSQRLKRHLMQKGHMCKSNAECQWLNAVCKKYPECSTGACACIGGTAEHNGKCKTTKEFGQQCDPRSDICLGYTSCTDGVCVCAEGRNCTEHINYSNEIKTRVVCQRDYDCYGMPGAQCRNGECACLDGSSSYVTTQLEYNMYNRNKYPRNNTGCIYSDVVTSVQPGSACDGKHLCATGLVCFLCPYTVPSICVTPELYDVIPESSEPDPKADGSPGIFDHSKYTVLQTLCLLSYVTLTPWLTMAACRTSL